MTQIFHLPFPPTANTMWRMGKGRLRLSEAYSRWKNDAGMAQMLQRPRPVKGPVRVVIGLRRKDKRKWDVDNRLKPVLDLLVSHLVLEEDHSDIVKEITGRVDPSIDVGAQVTITPL